MTTARQPFFYTGDAVVITPEFQVLLVERAKDPYKGAHALPGGHVEQGETGLQAAVRELYEETGVLVRPGQLGLLGIFDRPGRDPRGRYVSAAYVVVLPGNTRVAAGSDAKSVSWWPVDGLPYLAFDHREVIEAAVGKIS